MGKEASATGALDEALATKVEVPAPQERKQDTQTQQAQVAETLASGAGGSEAMVNKMEQPREEQKRALPRTASSPAISQKRKDFLVELKALSLPDLEERVLARNERVKRT